MGVKSYRKIIFLVFSILVIFNFSKTTDIQAESNDIIVEDFTTTTYLDGDSTNLTGWGSGWLELPRQNPEFLEQQYVPGFTKSLYVDGGLAYAGTYYGLYIYDVSNSSDISLLGNSDVLELGERVNDILVQNDTAYLATILGRLRIFNVSDSSNPSEMRELYLPGESGNIKIRDHLAYIPLDSGYVCQVDITNSSNPFIANNSIYTGSAAYGVAFSGDILYTAASGGIYSFNISSPEDVIYLDHLSLEGSSRKIEIKGNYAYVACYQGGLQVVDISNPSDMKRVAWLEDDSTYTRIRIVDNFIYLSGDPDSGASTMKIYDITIPHNPRAAGYYSQNAIGYDVSVDDDFAYVAVGGGFVSLRIAESGTHNSIYYMDYGVAISEYTYTATVGEILNEVNINYIDDALPTDTKTDYYFSIDGGSNWEVCLPGIPLVFQEKSIRLKMKVEMSSNNSMHSPILNSISVEISTADDLLVPIYPEYDSYINVTTPNLDWNDIVGTQGYNIVLSNSSSFDTTLINATILTLSHPSNYECMTPLEEGTYYWMVRFYIEYQTFGNQTFSDYSDIWIFHVGEEPIIIPELQITYLTIIILPVISILIIKLRKRKM